jgi:Fe-S oxidoreductase
MALEEYKRDMELCMRCSACKFIPLEMIKGYDHVNVCPSIARYEFHSYSGGGRINMAVGFLRKRFDYTDKLLHIIYNCQMCGGCDVSCKHIMDMEVVEPINEFRIRCVEDGHTLAALDGVIKTLREEGAMVPSPKADQGRWAEGIGVKDFTKEQTEVIYHAGCRTRNNEKHWKAARATIALLLKAGINVGIAGRGELCCGGRAYQMGYESDFLRQAKENLTLFEKSGAKILVTGCADCYHAFKVLYDKFNVKGTLEVLHTSEYLTRLIRSGDIKAARQIPATVTYHDPCHLGRLGGFYIHWKGKEVPGQIRIFDPPREFRRAVNGVYEPPRDLLKSIPGLKLVEMDRIKEYAWCCGAGGGVKEANPEFALWTAKERIREAESTGAEAIVTACPGCEQNLNDAVKENGSRLKVYDVVELLERATPGVSF